MELRNDLDQYVTELDSIDLKTFECRFADHDWTAEIVAGGFGLPHLRLTCHEYRDRFELALIESDDDDYEQDGSDPLQASGWAWRVANSDNILSTGWSDSFETASAALAEAMRETDS